MERMVRITYSAERTDMAKLMRILCEAVHSTAVHGAETGHHVRILAQSFNFREAAGVKELGHAFTRRILAGGMLRSGTLFIARFEEFLCLGDLFLYLVHYPVSPILYVFMNGFSDF